MSTFRQNSFAGGELSPAVQGRVDQQKYATGLATCRNFFVESQGAVSNRSGFQFKDKAKQSNGSVRCIDFIFSADVAYVIELGNLYARFFQAGVVIPHPPRLNLDGTPIVPADGVWTSGNSYDEGYSVFFAGIWYVCVDKALSPTTTPSTDDAVWYPNTGDIFELPTLWTDSQVFDIHYAQSADVMTATHRQTAPQDIKRLNVFEYDSIGDRGNFQQTFFVDDHSFRPILNPDNLEITDSTVGTETHTYAVTAEGDDGQESLQGGVDEVFEPPLVISGVSTGTITLITTTIPHTLEPGDPVLVFQNDTPGLNGPYHVAIIDDDTFSVEFDSEGITPGTAGAVGKLFVRKFLVDDPAPSTPIVIEWKRQEGTFRYAVYRQINGVFGFIGYAKGEKFKDTGGDPDFSSGPPEFTRPFSESGDYPSTLTYYQQRLCFANTLNQPETIWMSEVGRYNYFQKKVPLQIDGTIEFQLSGLRVNEVRNMVGLDNLAIFTSGGEWFVAGDQDGFVSPATLNARQNAYNGGATIQPLMINNFALYVQARQTIIRSLSFAIQSGGYQTTNMTIFADHIFDGRAIVDWAWQQVPHSIAWCVLDDGTLAGLTFIPEHDIWAWHRHETDGLVKSCCVIPENQEDVLYIVVDRQVEGLETRYHERLSERDLSDPQFLNFLDSSTHWNGENEIVGTGMQIIQDIGAMGWTYTDPLLLTHGAGPAFTASQVGEAYTLRNGEDSVIVEIKAFNHANEVMVMARNTVPLSLQNTQTDDWCRMAATIDGLDHLEGKSLMLFADGNVLGPYTVEAGSVTIGTQICKGWIGLPYTAELETLDLELLNTETLIDKRKLSNRLSLLVQETRGLWGGQTFDIMHEITQRQPSDEYDAVALATEKLELQLSSSYDDTGRIAIQQRDPLPATILSIGIGGKIGG